MLSSIIDIAKRYSTSRAKSKRNFHKEVISYLKECDGYIQTYIDEQRDYHIDIWKKRKHIYIIEFISMYVAAKDSDGIVSLIKENILDTKEVFCHIIANFPDDGIPFIKQCELLHTFCIEEADWLKHSQKEKSKSLDCEEEWNQLMIYIKEQTKQKEKAEKDAMKELKAQMKKLGLSKSKMKEMLEKMDPE